MVAGIVRIDFKQEQNKNNHGDTENTEMHREDQINDKYIQGFEIFSMKIASV